MLVIAGSSNDRIKRPALAFLTADGKMDCSQGDDNRAASVSITVYPLQLPLRRVDEIVSTAVLLSRLPHGPEM